MDYFLQIVLSLSELAFPLGRVVLAPSGWSAVIYSQLVTFNPYCWQ